MGHRSEYGIWMDELSGRKRASLREKLVTVGIGLVMTGIAVAFVVIAFAQNRYVPGG